MPSESPNALRDFAVMVHSTLGTKFEGYRLMDLKYDIHDDHNINADTKANELGYSSFKELIESDNFEPFVIILQDKESFDNATIYKARPTEAYKTLYDVQKTWIKHKKEAQARMLRRYAHCLPSSNNNNDSVPLNRSNLTSPQFGSRHGKKISSKKLPPTERIYPQGLGEPQGLDDQFDEEKKQKYEYNEDAEEYQDFRTTDSGNEEEKNKISQLKEEISQQKAKHFKNDINNTTTEKKNEHVFNVSSTSSSSNSTKLIKNDLFNGEVNRSKTTRQHNLIPTTSKISWDEVDSDEEEKQEQNINKHIPEGKLINFDDDE